MDFLERLAEGVIVADGAMGTMLYNRGIPKGHCYDELNLSHPSLIKEIHNEYIEAGAEIIETNTYGANEHILGKYYDLAERTREINISGAQIAREVVDKIISTNKTGAKIFVAGAIGPITRPLESAEKLTSSQMQGLFKSQICALIEGGIDLIIFESMASLDELICGFKVAKEICDLPIICQLVFTADGRTILGTGPVEAALKLEAAGAKIIGTNCGIGPHTVYEVITRMGHVSNAILSAQPNAGQASFSKGIFIYPATPEYVAEYAKKYVSAGVSIIGGCCGTTPAHIAAIKHAVEGKKPKPRKVIQFIGTGVKRQADIPKGKIISPLHQKLKEKFVTTLEIDPPKGTNFENELTAVQNFKQLGGDAVNIADNPMAKLRMSAISLAFLIKQKVDIDIILHFTCRDRNLLAIQSDLIGAHAIGIQNILALTGDPPAVGDYPFATAVFEIKSDGLIDIMNSLNQGRDWLSNPITEPTSFLIGVGTTLDDIERTKKKIDKGIGFIQTQPVFNIEGFKNFVSAFKGKDIPIIAGIFVLANLRHALFIHNEVPGISIPESIMKRMEDGCPNEGIIIARELLQQVKECCQGVCLMLPYGKYELINQIM
ncbi:MAG: bifunctional homocysteine S-methyltransferase/methylenetetrahydrofolate reductase [Candidatus Stahlbacteria bacterium]|nr:bifunctional homocysteine S-methyltransferase/methylenetetrahydrofolate reductase [Candidatus Stahlbacteria bacterium]